MSIRTYRMLASSAVLMAMACSAPAHALTMQECSTKYKAAESAGTLKGLKWNDFRKAECGTDATAAPAPSTAKAAAPAPATTGLAPSAAKAAAPATSAAAGAAAFPSAVSPKYSAESAGKARMLTCLDQYKANKASNDNGSLKWIQKGGGYYSECNQRLSRQ
jgi:hypothetical protein